MTAERWARLLRELGHQAIERRGQAGNADRDRGEIEAVEHQEEDARVQEPDGPERDTPAALRRYAVARGADLSDWSFLRGAAAEVDAVVRGYAVGSIRKPDGDIGHLSVTFLIDPEGRIAERYVGLDHAADELLRGVRRVLAPRSVL